MKIIKRNGSEVKFDIKKIVSAIERANDTVEGNDKITEEEIYEIAGSVCKKIKNIKRALNVEEIQDIVENELMDRKFFNLARKYVTYRYQRALVRKANTTDAQILSLIECNNEEVKQENSNKNPTVNSVQRDYMAGEVSKDVTKRFLLPPDIVKAHEESIIHFHDADYFAQHMHNCFRRNTKFITSNGTKSFEDYNDGDIVEVLSIDGTFNKAIVKKYGKQKVYKYVFRNGKHNFKEIFATENHRWYLNNGEQTTNLLIGDKLVKAPEIYKQEICWENLSSEEKRMWVYGFAIGDGSLQYQKSKILSHATKIRLCGEKDLSYLNRFLDAGCTLSSQKFDNGDKMVFVQDYQKECPNFKTKEEIKAFFNGLYCADGKMSINNPHSRVYRIQSSKKEIIELIRNYAETAGLYITKENDLTGEKTNFVEARKETILFSFNPNFSFSYKCIEKECVGEEDVWCLNVENTHNFVLSGGIPTGNCDLINLEDMLQNGTVISGTMIEKPHSFATACNIATQIIAQVASSQYGGQSISLSHLAPFVQVSREKIAKTVRKEFEETGIQVTEEQIAKVVESRVREEIKRGCQTIQYQVVTLMTTNGQAPFVTVFMYLNEVPAGRTRDDLAMIIEEVLKQRIEGVKNEKGVWVTPAFPKLIYVLEEDNINEGTPYWYLTELSARCTAKRMVPDYISEKMMLKLKVDKNGEGHCYTCMGCRSFLTPYVDSEGKPKYYGRFNQGVVTINLVDAACTATDVNDFFRILDERLDLCYRALMCRHNRLLGTLSDAAPNLWQYGALARLQKGEKIDKLLFGGYSTISLGYAGLWETVYKLSGKKLTDPEGEKLGLKIMKKLNEACAGWKKKENIDFSLYGTPLESTTYKFAKALQKKFGIIPGVTDKNYITNSYHIHVTEEIDAFSKLAFESKFQELSPGGAISYVEVPNMNNNIPAVLDVMKFIYDNIMYAELNTKSDYCQECGYDGEILIVKDADGKLVWECPKCGNRDQSKLNVARRTCGYIGSQFWNQGRTQEIKERVLHL